MLETGCPVIRSGITKGMNVFMVDIAPVLERDSQLEGGLGCRHELLFLDIEQPVIPDQWRNGRLTNADGSDLVRFDQCDVEHLAHGF